MRPGSTSGTTPAGRRRHGKNTATLDRCLCGQPYPQQCRGGIPILRAATGQRIWDLAGQGVSFRRIARETGVSTGTIRRVVHGT